MQLYLDSNIYLEYFRENSAERLAPLRELVKLISAEKIKLLIPSQTREEYFRNRRKIAELTRTALVSRSKTPLLIPATLDNNIPEVKNISKNAAALANAYKKLIEKYDKSVEKEKTDADLLIKKLFLIGESFPEEENIVKKAHVRYMKGNPPRKSDHSYGDAIIWETLLEKGKNDDPSIISKDSDFMEKHKGEYELNSFLSVEWRIKTKKKKHVKLYKSLAEFVNKFNKKQTIKKEVVEIEKREQPAYTGFNSTVFPQSVNLNEWVINTDYSPFKFSDSLGSINLLSNSVIRNNTPSFCPYCGAILASPYVNITIENSRTCGSCGRKFDII